MTNSNLDNPNKQSSPSNKQPKENQLQSELISYITNKTRRITYIEFDKNCGRLCG